MCAAASARSCVRLACSKSSTVKADFGDGNIVDVVKGDTIHFLYRTGYDRTAVGVPDWTERVIVAVDQVRVEVTLDFQILNIEVDGRPVSVVDEGTRIYFRRNAQFRVMFRGFDTTSESHFESEQFLSVA